MSGPGPSGDGGSHGAPSESEVADHPEDEHPHHDDMEKAGAPGEGDDDPDLERELILDPESDPPDPGPLGRPLSRRSPFVWGLFGGAGFLLSQWVFGLLMAVGSVLILIVVSLFLAVGLNPAVEWLMRRGVRRSWSVLLVILAVVAVIAGFVLTVAPVVSDQVTAMGNNLPDWVDRLRANPKVQDLDAKYHVIEKLQSYIQSGDLARNLFGGVLGIGLRLLGFLANVFVVIVLTLYFLGSLPAIRRGAYRLAPASRRDRVTALGDQVLASVGGYVSGAFVVALCAGVSTLVFLFAVGLGSYAVALALVVALLDVIPMVGATLGAVIVSAIGFATDLHTGIVCVIFYVIYQQVENYLIYPRVMSRSVDIPGAVTVIAALVGASLLGVVGALLAIPTAAAILLIVDHVVVPRQESR